MLITGASGLIGGVLLDGLAHRYDVQGVDRSQGPRVTTVADSRRLEQLTAAFDGVDTVIDLAANADANAGWDDVCANNLAATLNAFEAARLTRVRRLVYASSNHAVGLAEHDQPYASILAGRYAGLDPASIPRLAAQAPVRPDGPYGIGKVFGEAIARHHAETYGISALCLRIGSVNRDDRPTSPRQFSIWLSHRDLVQLVQCCLAAPDSVRFGIYFGVSANRWRIWEIENARRELGYEPRDDAERWR